MVKTFLLIILTAITYLIVLSGSLGILAFLAMTMSLSDNSNVPFMSPKALYIWWKEQFVKLAGAIEWLKNESN